MDNLIAEKMDELSKMILGKLMEFENKLGKLEVVFDSINEIKQDIRELRLEINGSVNINIDNKAENG